MITRETAIQIARNHAMMHRASNNYLPQNAQEFKTWMPHEWVISAIIDASDSLHWNRQEQGEQAAP